MKSCLAFKVLLARIARGLPILHVMFLVHCGKAEPFRTWKWVLHCLFTAILTLCKHVGISTSHSLKLTVFDRYKGVRKLQGKFATSIWVNGKHNFFGKLRHRVRSCSSCWRSPYLSSKFWAASWHLEPRYHVQHISHLGLIDIMFGCEKTQWWWSWQASPQSAKFQNQSLISMWHTSMSYAAHCYNGVQVGLCLWLCNALLLQTQAHAPVNLITETYDHLEIRRHKDLESFVKHKQEQAWQLTKAKQASR